MGGGEWVFCFFFFCGRWTVLELCVVFSGFYIFFHVFFNFVFLERLIFDSRSFDGHFASGLTCLLLRFSILGVGFLGLY